MIYNGVMGARDDTAVIVTDIALHARGTDPDIALPPSRVNRRERSSARNQIRMPARIA